MVTSEFEIISASKVDAIEFFEQRIREIREKHQLELQEVRAESL